MLYEVITDRVLLQVSNVCSMYCRHCTRKRKVGEVAGKRMEVVVDGVPVGVTPWEGPVSPGPHAVRNNFV